MNKIGIRLIQMSAVYMVLGLALGMAMAITHNFQARSIHTHVSLLGWMAMGLTGVSYAAVPNLANGLAPKIHFWMHVVGLPLMMSGLAFITFGKPEWEPVVGLGSFLTTGGLFCFAWSAIKSL